MARWWRREEADVNHSMRRSLTAMGWRVASLQADGLLVERRADGRQPDLSKVQAHVERDTGFKVKLALKSMEVTGADRTKLGLGETSLPQATETWEQSVARIRVPTLATSPEARGEGRDDESR